MLINTQTQPVSRRIDGFVPSHRVQRLHQRLVEMTNIELNAWSTFGPTGNPNIIPATQPWDQSAENFEINENISHHHFDGLPLSGSAAKEQSNSQIRGSLRSTITQRQPFIDTSDQFLAKGEFMSQGFDTYEDRQTPMDDSGSSWLLDESCNLGVDPNHRDFPLQGHSNAKHLNIRDNLGSANHSSSLMQWTPSSGHHATESFYDKAQTRSSDLDNCFSSVTLSHRDPMLGWSSGIMSFPEEDGKSRRFRDSSGNASGPAYPTAKIQVHENLSQPYQLRTWLSEPAPKLCWPESNPQATISPTSLFLPQHPLPAECLQDNAIAPSTFSEHSSKSRGSIRRDLWQSESVEPHQSDQKLSNQLNPPQHENDIGSNCLSVPILKSNHHTASKTVKAKDETSKLGSNLNRPPQDVHDKRASAGRPSRQEIIDKNPISSLQLASPDRRDQFLVLSKLAGMSYKEIRRRGHYTEAESTLRGRFRTLTKPKTERVRKPEWSESDIQLLEDAVYSLVREIGPKRKVPWKRVAQYVADHGGSYHFGAATAKKKWDELHE